MPGGRMEAVHALEVYIGERGYVCIRQEDPLGDTADIVALLPQQVPAVCQWLTDCAAEVLARAGADEAAAAAVLSPPPQLQPPRVLRADGPAA